MVLEINLNRNFVNYLISIDQIVYLCLCLCSNSSRSSSSRGIQGEKKAESSKNCLDGNASFAIYFVRRKIVEVRCSDLLVMAEFKLFLVSCGQSWIKNHGIQC